MLPRLITSGDHEEARLMFREGVRQLDILKGLMKFGELKQDVRKVNFSDGSEIICKSVFGIDEVRIHVPEEFKEKPGWVTPRFFAYVVKKDPETGSFVKKYYWLYFYSIDDPRPGGEDFISSQAVQINDRCFLHSWMISGELGSSYGGSCEGGSPESNKELVEKMRKIPNHSKSAFTKAFMFYNASDVNMQHGIRCAASGHLLVSKYATVFEPINWPNCLGAPINYQPPPLYPRPAYADLSPSSVALRLTYPPNRFYCNIEERMMVWYTAKTHNPEISGQDYICGVILDFNSSTFRSFLLYPSDGGHGFTPYFKVAGTNIDVPTSMIAEVQVLTEQTLELTIAWCGRPVKVTLNLRTGGVTYAEIGKCDHRVWTEDGFDKVPLADLEQEFEDPIDPADNLVTQPGYNCHTHDGCLDACYESEGHRHEVRGHQTLTVLAVPEISKSEYLITVFEKEFLANSYRHYTNIGESLSSRQRHCLYSATYSTCFGNEHTNNMSRYIEGNLNDKQLDSGYASWINPNSSFLLRTRTQDYLQGTAKYNGYHYGGPTLGDWHELCPMERLWGEFSNYVTYPCLLRMENIPGDIWGRLGNEVYEEYVGGSCKLERSSNKDEDEEADINQYDIDGEITLDSTVVDRLYYLDDRATDANQGVLVGGKGNSGEHIGSTDYVPDFWEIKWNFNDTGYVDIKSKILEVLGCTMEELIDIGLV